MKKIFSFLLMAVGGLGSVFGLSLILTAIPYMGEQRTATGGSFQMGFGQVFLVISLVILAIGVFIFLRIRKR